MNRLIIIEGIPGSGKTTLARKLYQKISEYTGQGAPIRRR